MIKQNINGIVYCNFGCNNYSYGLEAVTFNPREINPKQILALKGFFLHPNLEPNSEEIFALKGNAQNYKKFCDAVAEQEAIKFALKKLGVDSSFLFGHPSKEEWNKYEELKKSFIFVPWFLSL